jgi:4a-hydroxytetrahydrobiopterin dehydratase
MPRPIALTEAEIAEGVERLPEWSRDGLFLRRTIKAKSFADAISLIVHIGFLAEAADHHPDIDLRWRNVSISLTTHDAGGISVLDLELANLIDLAAVGTK